MMQGNAGAKKNVSHFAYDTFGDNDTVSSSSTSKRMKTKKKVKQQKTSFQALYSKYCNVVYIIPLVLLVVLGIFLLSSRKSSLNDVEVKYIQGNSTSYHLRASNGSSLSQSDDVPIQPPIESPESIDSPDSSEEEDDPDVDDENDEDDDDSLPIVPTDDIPIPISHKRPKAVDIPGGGEKPSTSDRAKERVQTSPNPTVEPTIAVVTDDRPWKLDPTIEPTILLTTLNPTTAPTFRSELRLPAYGDAPVPSPTSAVHSEGWWKKIFDSHSHKTYPPSPAPTLDATDTNVLTPPNNHKDNLIASKVVKASEQGVSSVPSVSPTDAITTKPSSSGWLNEIVESYYHKDTTKSTPPSQSPTDAAVSAHESTSSSERVASTAPVSQPSPEPFANPTKPPSLSPISTPTYAPIIDSTPYPNADPTMEPTSSPVAIPTLSPTEAPTQSPLSSPTISPTPSPISNPTPAPSLEPSVLPIAAPSAFPTLTPTSIPISTPTFHPVESTPYPNADPTITPTEEPIAIPTDFPTESPTSAPLAAPSLFPVSLPSSEPSASPTTGPTNEPVSTPTLSPSQSPTPEPIAVPTLAPTTSASEAPFFNNLRTISLKVSDAHSTEAADHVVSSRSGFAVSSAYVLLNAKKGVASWFKESLRFNDVTKKYHTAFITDLLSGKVYSLGNSVLNPMGKTEKLSSLILLEADGEIASNGDVLTLSDSVDLPQGSAIFSGVGNALFINGVNMDAYLLDFASGTLTLIQHKLTKRWEDGPDWVAHGVLERFELSYSISYGSQGLIERQRLDSGQTSVIFQDGRMSDVSQITLDTANSRWYFTYDGSGAFGQRRILVGYADAKVKVWDSWV